MSLETLKSRSRAAVDAVRPLLRLVRHGPDRLLHPLRRRRLLRRLRGAPAPRSALFICLGNINRSPFAEAAFRKAVEERGVHGRIRIASAGFIGPGRPASEHARRLAAARGMDLEGHVSRQIDPAEVRATDLVVVMDVKQRRRVAKRTGRPGRDIVVLGDLDPARIVRRTMQDPYGHAPQVYERVFHRVQRCVEALADAVL